MVIGHFTPSRDGGWVGSIRTLLIDVRLRLVPNDERSSRKSPAFRVLIGNTRVGDAWEAKTSGVPPRAYLRVRLDDPLLARPIAAALFEEESGLRAQLLWTRRRHDPKRDEPHEG